MASAAKYGLTADIMRDDRALMLGDRALMLGDERYTAPDKAPKAAKLLIKDICMFFCFY